MPPTQIFRIINRLNVGGPATHVALLTAGLNSGQVRSTLVAGRVGPSEGDMTGYAQDLGVTMIVLPEMSRGRSVFSPFKDLVALFKLYRLLKRHRPDIVHTHTAIGGFLGRTAAILAGVPIRVHTFHGHVFDQYYPWVLTRFFLFLERLLGRFTQAIVALSESQAQDLAFKYRIAPREKFAVIHLGLDLAPFLACQSLRGEVRRELGVDDDVRLVGIVGRLVPVKNHRLFLDAAARIVREEPTARFLVVGDGFLRSGLEDYSRKLGIASEVVFTGWRRDLPRIYADLDVLVVASDNEGTPLAVIEAMAAGRPVVATRVGGVPDVVADGETGRLVPPRDADRLAEAVLALLRDPREASRMGERGREAAQQRFSLERLLADTAHLYARLLAATGKSIDTTGAQGPFPPEHEEVR